MAVTQIRKISSWTLLVLLAVSLVVIGVFFFVGTPEITPSGNKNYQHTNMLLYWAYILVAAVVLTTVLFSVFGFIKSFKTNKKGAVKNLLMIIALIGILAITYTLGDGTPLSGIGEDSQKFNTSGWLKLIDMCIYTVTALGGLTILAIIWNSITKAIKK